MLQDTYTNDLFYCLVLLQIFVHVDSTWTQTISSSSVHNGPYVPQNAIDGNPSRDAARCGCCAATAPELNPWYQLDFVENRTVHRIHVEGRTDTHTHGQHFQGLQIYLKSVHAGFSVGEETRITEATYIVDYCLPEPKSTRFVTLVLFNVKRVFTICEVTIYGKCTEGTFGGYCGSICHCDGDSCDTLTGECPSGICLPGYKGEACDTVCTDGKYGPGCTESCGNCVGAGICHKQDGRCPGQCTSGYLGDTCKRECDDGFYGPGCTKTCGNCHNGEPCDIVTGYCKNGCAAGYQTDAFCKTGCTPGTYGVGCFMRCGNCKADTTVCAKTDGVCPTGCVAGYMGDICKTECEDGSYGENCNSNCGNCLNGTLCNKKTGVCVSGCNAGYTSDLCTDECPTGFYGDGCSTVCGNCVTNKSCHHINGTCCDGCKAGFKGRLCVKECDDGFYGPNCALVCGNCRNGEPCDRTLGFCKDGCSDGYQPDLLCKTAIQIEEEVNEYLYMYLSISGLSFGAIALLIAIGSIILMRIQMRAIQERVKAESHIYEIPNTPYNFVDQEHPYGNTTGNAQGHVYTNLELL